MHFHCLPTCLYACTLIGLYFVASVIVMSHICSIAYMDTHDGHPLIIATAAQCAYGSIVNEHPCMVYIPRLLYACTCSIPAYMCMCSSILNGSATHVYFGTSVSAMDVQYRKKLHGVYKMLFANGGIYSVPPRHLYDN